MAYPPVTSPPVLVLAAPWPPVPNGIADYAATITPYLARHFKTVLIVDDYAPEPPSDLGDRRRYSEYLAAGGIPGAIHLYQIGNNKDCTWMLSMMEQFPGVSVVHDLSLNHLFKLWAQEIDDWEARITAPMMEAYGSSGFIIARGFIDHKYRLKSFDQEIDFLPWVARKSLGLISHSQTGAQILAGHSKGNTYVAHVPHFVSVLDDPKRSSHNRQMIRRKHGIARDRFVLTMLGFMSRRKQVERILRAMRSAMNENPCFDLLIAGREDPSINLQQSAREHGLEGRVKQAGYVSDDDLGAYIDASDLILSLRYPTQYEASGIVCRALGRGAVCVVPREGWFDELPSRAVFKVSHSEDPEDLKMILLAAATNPDLIQQRSQFAKQLAREQFSLEQASNLYRDLLGRVVEDHQHAVPAPGKERTSKSEIVYLPCDSYSGAFTTDGESKSLLKLHIPYTEGVDQNLFIRELLQKQVQQNGAACLDLLVCETPLNVGSSSINATIEAASTAIRQGGAILIPIDRRSRGIMVDLTGLKPAARVSSKATSVFARHGIFPQTISTPASGQDETILFSGRKVATTQELS